MKWVRDTTGRFRERPHYEPEELDQDCEEFAHKILRERHMGQLVFPIPMDDLTIMVEKSGADLDSSADLSYYGPTVEGVTEFCSGEKPVVRISSQLADNPRLENRLRTTLTHECGHVRHHRYLLEMKTATRDLFAHENVQRQACKRETIAVGAPADWMEWQAGYCCGALLMPFSNVKETMRAFMLRHGTGPFPLSALSSEGQDLIERVVADYGVSRQAAYVRLVRLGGLVDERGLTSPLWS
jgi:Zn-dependent peptidase ImmA (M78 family)